MLADLIRAFCKENNYEVRENYTKAITTPIGEETITTIGIIVKGDRNILSELTSFLEAKEFVDSLLELDGAAMDELGPDAILYFPAVQDYHPLQP